MILELLLASCRVTTLNASLSNHFDAARSLSKSIALSTSGVSFSACSALAFGSVGLFLRGFLDRISVTMARSSPSLSISFRMRCSYKYSMLSHISA